MKRAVFRFLPLLFILAVTILAQLLGWTEYLSFDSLQEYRADLLAFVKAYPYLAPASYMGVYTLSTALSLPGGAFLSVCGGFLFGQPFATLYIVLAATLGACVIFLAAKTSLGAVLRERAGKRIKKIEAKIAESAASYLLFLRLVPLFPFWLVNLAPAFVGVGLWTFAWTTAVGIIPGSFVLSQAGEGLGSILDKGETLSIQSLFTTEMKIALFALGLFALTPLVYRWWKTHA